MTLRDNLTPERRWAHAVLDDVREALRLGAEETRARCRKALAQAPPPRI